MEAVHLPVSLGGAGFKIAVIGLMVANCVSPNFILHPIGLICVSLNPLCPVDLGRSLRLFLSLSIQLRPLNILAMTGPVVPIRMPKIRIVCLMRKKG